MNDESTTRGGRGAGTLARDFVPDSHRHLPLLRIFLPFEGELGIVRWSRYVDVEENPASIDWFEATADIAAVHPDIRELTSSMGQLDEQTADAINDVIGGTAMTCLRWVGYGEVPTTSAPTRKFGEEYFEADLTPEDVAAGRRIPEFAWDAGGRLAWGGRLYPDSLIVAAEIPIFRQLRNDPRLDTASVIAHRDVLPRSAGD